MRFSFDFGPSARAARANRSASVSFSELMEVGEVGVLGATTSCFSGAEVSIAGSGGNVGGFIPEISIRGLAGTRAREPEVALEAALPGRFGATSLDRGALSESSESESELSEEL